MSALNFAKRFAGAVESGAKRQTIRAFRRDGRRPCKVGGALQLYTGMRTAYCRKIADATCTGLHVVTLERHRVTVDGEALPRADMRPFAEADGFTSYGDMFEWAWEYTNGDAEFTGYLIKWEINGGS